MRGRVRRAERGWLSLMLLGAAASACRSFPDSPPAPEAEPGGGRFQACVLPLGDSITQGGYLQPSYRFWLWSNLHSRGVAANFVGSMQESHAGSPGVPREPFDRDHEGHWGWRADQILEGLPVWLQAYQPGIVLLHLGTNDCTQGQSAMSTIAELRMIIGVLRARNPQVAVLLAKLIPLAEPVANACLSTLNALVPALAAETTTVGSPIIVVDHNTGFDPATETYDGSHPNDAGEKKMAQRWHEALLPLLAEAQPCP